VTVDVYAKERQHGRQRPIISVTAHSMGTALERVALQVQEVEVENGEREW
jgi:esterase/lipase superfamily enzyme